MALAQFYRNELLNLSPSAWIAIGGAFVLLMVVVVLVVQRMRRDALIRRFGAEYDSAVEEYGTEQAAQQQLRARERRIKKLSLRALNGRQVDHVENQWLKVQAGFVESPLTAVRGANSLIKMIMHERGFRSENFEQRLADLSVDHAKVVRHYRAARALSEPEPAAPDATEDLRQAMLHYGSVVEELMNPTAAAQTAWREQHAS